MPEKDTVWKIREPEFEFDDRCREWSDPNEYDPEPGALVGFVEVADTYAVETWRMVGRGPGGGRVMFLIDKDDLTEANPLEAIAAAREIPWPE